MSKFYLLHNNCDSAFSFLLKVDLLKNKLGFDAAFNYKEEHDLDAALKRSVSIRIRSNCIVRSYEKVSIHSLHKGLVNGKVKSIVLKGMLKACLGSRHCHSLVIAPYLLPKHVPY